MKKIFRHLYGVLSILIGLFAIYGSATNQQLTSYTTGTIQLSPKEHDIFTKKSLSNYIKSTPNPTIVLRVPNLVDRVLDESKYSKSQIYYTIEKEFAKADFIVRDRALYQKILDQNISTDYSKIKELTNTDLIIELVGYDIVNFNTNTYYDKKNNLKTSDANFTLKGSKIEFKLIRVKDNDLVGSYTFYFTPCTSGCTYMFDNYGRLYSINIKGKAISQPYEFVSNDQLEEFIKVSTQYLIEELKK